MSTPINPSIWNSKNPNAGEIKTHIDPVSRKKSYVKACALLAIVAVFYGVTFVGCLTPIWWIAVICIPSNGLAIGMFFIIGHDACHSCYTPGKKVDHWIARIVFLPSFWSYECWKVVHNYLHHGFTCLKDCDYAWLPLSIDEYNDLTWTGRQLERFYKSHLGLGLYWIIEIWWKHGMLPRGKDVGFLAKRKRELLFDRISMGVFLFGEIAVCCAIYFRFANEYSVVAALQAVVLGIVLPFLVWSFLGGIVIFVQHTHPNTVWFKDKAEWSFFSASIRDTVHFQFPFPVNKLFLDVMEHNAHHVDPTIPIYNLLLQQKNLERAYPDDITVEDFSFKTMRRIFRTCQLYDYDRHCWLSFEGQPTTKPVFLDVANKLDKPTDAI